MRSLVVSFLLIIIGYILYGRLTAKIFSPDGRKTPAIAINDGVDCVPMPKWKTFLVQLLNIAGTGPIFGALMGAQFGPVVFLWIVFGSILGGAVHDYMSGMISCRNGGQSIAELSGKYLGKAAKWIMRVFSVALLILIGTVFISSPAALLTRLFPGFISEDIWMLIILLYYILATLLPIDKLIGRIYPVMGLLLIVMAIGILGGLTVTGSYAIPEITLQNLHVDGQPVWPYMFVTVACGAISGFHATQSPMMAKCIKTEKEGRLVFFGAMLSEALIALAWAAAGVSFYDSTGTLTEALAEYGQAGVVYNISLGVMGQVGGLLAVIGVIVCPITSGDTAFRSARLIIAEWTGLDQKNIWKRLLITLPLLAVGGILTKLDFDVLWRYSSWSNQTLAMIALWVATAYLIREGKYRFGSLVTALPAAFMTAVSVTYICMAKEGFCIPQTVSYIIGVAVAAALAAVYFIFLAKELKKRSNGRLDGQSC